MRTRLAAAVLFVATALPNVGNAQVYQLATPPPSTTAAAAPWQIDSVPIMVNGVTYQPTALVRAFDGNVMVQVGVLDNVPVYADATLEPYSVLYVPVARGMRTYERLRAGLLAGTTGSQAPMRPVEPITALRPSESPVAANGVVPPSTDVDYDRRDLHRAPMVLTRSEPPTRVETVPQPRATDGVWIRFEGIKWYSAGEAVPFASDRFTRIGTYYGFPVYRRHDGGAREIWVTVVSGGPVAPYARR